MDSSAACSSMWQGPWEKTVVANTQDYNHIEDKHNRFAAKPHEPSCLCGARQKQVHPLVEKMNYFFYVPISSFFFSIFFSFSRFSSWTLVEQPHTIHYPKKLYRSSVNNMFSLLFIVAWVLALSKNCKKICWTCHVWEGRKKYKVPQRTEQDGSFVKNWEKHQISVFFFRILWIVSTVDQVNVPPSPVGPVCCGWRLISPWCSLGPQGCLGGRRKGWNPGGNSGSCGQQLHQHLLERSQGEKKLTSMFLWIL